MACGNVSCSGGCTSNCTGGCGAGCSGSGNERGNRSDDGRYRCNGCGFACADGGGCKGGCAGTCSGDCSGCGGSCSGSCEGTCKGTCEGKCLGSCVNACKGTCKGMCLGGCSTACKGSCNHLCNTTCTNSVAETAYAFLNNIKDKLSKSDYEEFNIHDSSNGIVLDYLDSEDMNQMFTLLKEEGRRRHLQLNEKGEPIGKKNQVFDYNTLNTVQQEKIGGINNRVLSKEFADDTKIKKINDLLIKNTSKSTGLFSINSELVEGGSINRAIGVALIKKMLEAYQDMVGVPSVSQSAGVQEN